MKLHPIVTPRMVEGLSWSLHPRGPMLTIQCGECGGHHQQRVPVVNYPTVQCPYCGTLNRLPLVRDD